MYNIRMNRKPTIAAFVIFAMSLILAFLITVSEQEAKVPKKDVEIFVVKPPIDVPKSVFNNEKLSFYKATKDYLKIELKNRRRFLFLVVDSYEIEISDFWREVLNHFEIFEYYKAYPEAFIRRLILMPTFTGNKELLYEDDSNEKPVVYPDYDYRSIRYRVSLVPNTIDNLKAFIDFFYFRIKLSLGLS